MQPDSSVRKEISTCLHGLYFFGVSALGTGINQNSSSPPKQLPPLQLGAWCSVCNLLSCLEFSEQGSWTQKTWFGPWLSKVLKHAAAGSIESAGAQSGQDIINHTTRLECLLFSTSLRTLLNCSQRQRFFPWFPLDFDYYNSNPPDPGEWCKWKWREVFLPFPTGVQQDEIESCLSLLHLM